MGLMQHDALGLLALLTFQAQAPWTWLVAAVAVLIALVLLGALLTSRRAGLGRTGAGQVGSVALSLLTAGLLYAAAWGPTVVAAPQPDRAHLAVVFDISRSALRAVGGWPQVRDGVSHFLDATVAGLPAARRGETTGSIIGLAAQAATMNGPMPITVLPAAVRDLQQVDVAAESRNLGDGTDLAVGLRAAGDAVAASGGRGVVLLVSDGLQTTGDGAAVAADLAEQGIPVFVAPLTSLGAGVALASANLPAQVYEGQQTFVRGELWNGRTTAQAVVLQIALNRGLDAHTPRVGKAAAVRSTAPLELPSNGAGNIRAPATFAGSGLQYADVTVSVDHGASVQRERLFTQVKRPLRLLAIGDDRAWEGAFAPSAASIVTAAPGRLSAAGDPQAYDVIVVSGAAAAHFAPGELARVASAVKTGVGLMVMNGAQTQSSTSLLKTYDHTPLAPLLPVVSGPRPLELTAPRHIIFVVDTSGSMDDILGTDATGQDVTKLDKAKEIMLYIIEHDLRPTDTLDLISFTTGAPDYTIKDEPATMANKVSWRGKILALNAAGGTDPTQAMQALAAERLQHCGLFLFTDGEFDAVQQKPTCRSAVFITGSQPNLQALDQIADPFSVDAGFSPASVKIPYFVPRKRNTFWTPGVFTPLPSGERSTLVGDLPSPPGPVDGAAVTHLRNDADLIALRPKLVDPVLAYRRSGTGGAGYVGVLTTGVPPAWVQRAAGRAAVAQWIDILAPNSASDRYAMTAHDDGDTLSLQIALVPHGGRIPQVTGLGVSVAEPGGQVTPLEVSADAGAPATFDADAALSRDGAAHEASLVITESGPDAIARPQRIPLVIPPAGDVAPPVGSEEYSVGSDARLLAAIAAAGGGAVVRAGQTADLFGSAVASSHDQPLWPYCLAAAALCYLAAIALRRWGA